MAWGNVDFSGFVELRDRIERLQRVDLDAFCKQVVSEITQRFSADIVARTPQKTGELSKHWVTGDITKSGNVYQIEIINPFDYAEYVEFGHRKRNDKGWVPGFFMMTIAERDLQRDIDEIIREKLEAFLREFF